MLAKTGRRVANNHDFLVVVTQLMRDFLIDRDMAEEVARRALEAKVEGLGIE